MPEDIFNRSEHLVHAVHRDPATDQLNNPRRVDGLMAAEVVITDVMKLTVSAIPGIW